MGSVKTRRKFLQQAALFAGASLIPISVNSWVSQTTAQTKNNKRLIVIFLRGAADGLSVVVPYADANYYQARPTIAIPPLNKEGGVFNLNGYFGLNPALKNLMPLWRNGSLAFVHACGSPASTRSHFDAQDYMESGTPGVKNTSTGWMNRLLAILPKGTPVQGLNLGNTTPRILTGPMSVANLARGRNYKRPLAVDRPLINAMFDRLYSDNSAISQAYQEGQKARKILLAELDREMSDASRGAPTPVNFATDTRKVARLMVSDAKTQLAFMDLGGWDTHINQVPQLKRNLNSLAEGLTTLVQELGSLYQDTVITVISEFGRTLRENGNLGTDHGHGNVIWVLGGNIRGGKIYGNWPGLDNSQLFEGRDLAVTTDFREVIGHLLIKHLEISPGNLSQVFPGYTLNNYLDPLIS